MNRLALEESPGRIGYAQCWEDADVLMAALDVQPGQTCLSIASGGDNTLALLARGPQRVIAVDHNPSQLHCLALRVAAYRQLDYDDLLGFLGVRPSTHRRELYARCRTTLGTDARAFWDRNGSLIENGIVNTGRFEKYLALFRRCVLPFMLSGRTVAALVDSGSHQWRVQHFDRHINTWRFRQIFRVFFSRALLEGMGRHPGAFRFAEGSVSEHLLGRLRYVLTELDPAENPYLQWILCGRFVQALPFALRQEHFASIRRNLGALELYCGSLGQCLDELGDGEVARFNLSDVFEYLSLEETGHLFDAIGRVCAPQGRVAYWNMLVPRSCPDSTRGKLRALTKRAAELHQQDKAFFYDAFHLEERGPC